MLYKLCIIIYKIQNYKFYYENISIERKANEELLKSS